MNWCYIMTIFKLCNWKCMQLGKEEKEWERWKEMEKEREKRGGREGRKEFFNLVFLFIFLNSLINDLRWIFAREFYLLFQSHECTGGSKLYITQVRLTHIMRLYGMRGTKVDIVISYSQNWWKEYLDGFSISHIKHFVHSNDIIHIVR